MSDWISVDDSLPESSNRPVAFLFDWDGDLQCAGGMFHYGKFLTEHGDLCQECGEVRYWMYLPNIPSAAKGGA